MTFRVLLVCGVVLRYVRILGAFYLRLVGKPVDIYKYLELLYNDFRKIRHRTTSGVCDHALSILRRAGGPSAL